MNRSSWDTAPVDTTMLDEQPQKGQTAGDGESRLVVRKPRGKLSFWKKAIYGLIVTLLFFATVEFALHVAGVRPHDEDVDPFVGFAARIPLFVPHPGNSSEMVTAENKLPWFNAQRFSQQKRPDSYRIFCLGGSTTYGRPYDDATSFSGWMREFLNATNDTKSFEVINAGGISYASHRVALVLDEILDYSPDLVVVYTGHNEFLEERKYESVRDANPILRRCELALSQTRSYTVINDMLHSSRKDLGNPAPTQNLMPAEVKTRLDYGIGPDSYYRDDALHARILEQFEFNLQEIVETARAGGAQVILVTPASNLKDCSPFKSEVSTKLTADEQATFHRRLAEARIALANGQVEQSFEATDKAILIDDRCADAHFLRGQILEQLGQYRESHRAYVRARDEDVCPLRAISTIREVVLKIGNTSHTAVVDFQKWVEEESTHGIPGENLFLDHVHPTVEGHRQLALKILTTMIGSGMLTAAAKLDEETIVRITTTKLEQIDQKAHGQALRNLAKVFAWAGKREEANRMALRADKLLTDDANVLYLAANALITQGDLDGAIKKLEAAVVANPGQVDWICSLGVAYQKKGDVGKAIKHYQHAIEVDAGYAPAHNNLGALYVDLKQWDSALEHLQKATSIAPRYADAQYNLGILHTNRQQWGRAIECLRTAININPKYAQAHEHLGKVHAFRGEFEPAVAHLRQALQLEPQRWMTANQLAWVLATSPKEETRNGKEAVRWALHSAEGTRYQNPSVVNTLAAAYAEAGDFATAIVWQQKALDVAPEKMRPACQQLLDLYKSGRPFHVKLEQEAVP